MAMRSIALPFAFCAILSAQGAAREVYTEAVISGPLPGLHNNYLYFIDRPNRVRLFTERPLLDIIRCSGSNG
jgi:hypothetical protein